MKPRRNTTKLPKTNPITAGGLLNYLLAHPDLWDQEVVLVTGPGVCSPLHGVASGGETQPELTLWPVKYHEDFEERSKGASRWNE